jgi:hypothetical protein
MEIAARIMITGGDEREDARMTRADRLLIRTAIFLAAKSVKASGRDQVLTLVVTHEGHIITTNRYWLAMWSCVEIRPGLGKGLPGNCFFRGGT